ncbi:MAG: DUF1439 domain-containing protein [Proteobacteria bacterium]|nr:DUF1439 domain-containing protein [Pseudomonadota bacterium]
MRLPTDFLRGARVVWLALLLSACAGVLGPRTIVLSEDELQALIARHFPFSNRMLDVLQVDVDLPRISIRQDTERIAVLLRVRTRGSFPKTPYVGTLALTCGVRFEPGDNSVRLADVRVERFEIEGASADVQRLLGPIGRMVTEQALEGRAIYALRAKDLAAVEGHGYRPGGVRVTHAGVEITLVPL